MKSLGNYENQAKEIARLSKELTQKAKNFAKENKNESPYYQELSSIIYELEELTQRLK